MFEPVKQKLQNSAHLRKRRRGTAHHGCYWIMACELNGICTQFIELEPSVYKGDSKRLSERVSAREKLSLGQKPKSVTGQTLSCVLRLFP